ncbi:hypothetical protein FOA52_003078 [Chlamydomonas sp. UWO 241]|nr:hypothetical protein FOA52_003078 [Chlamydomonas sp. UWO 241]
MLAPPLLSMDAGGPLGADCMQHAGHLGAQSPSLEAQLAAVRAVSPWGTVNEQQRSGACGLSQGVANGMRAVPDFAQSIQPKILKQINSFNTKEDLLTNAAACHQVLDEINLTTCIYRLARLYNNVRGVAARRRWASELHGNFMFHLLLRTLHSHLLHAQLQLMQQPHKFRGFDARCVSNLIWALVKLEVPTEPGALGHEVVHAVSPLVLHFLPMASSQGLANLLWAYSKMTEPVLHVMMMIVAEMTGRLQCAKSPATFDAQALSNAIWALAHVRSRVSDLDAIAGIPGLTLSFMGAVASSAVSMLNGLRTRTDQGSMLESERAFSCQALVNIVWSFATLLGENVTRVAPVRALFGCICAEALIRLAATASALQLNQGWAPRLLDGFNEQAFSNIVYAYDKAQLLDADLLQSIFTVAALRLERCGGRPSFKPQELCTLLRAAQSSIAQPWAFLEKLHSVLCASPHIVSEWGAGERAELERALALLEMYRTAVLMERMRLQQEQEQAQMQQAQEHHAQFTALAAAPSYSMSSSYSSGGFSGSMW